MPRLQRKNIKKKEVNVINKKKGAISDTLIFN